MHEQRRLQGQVQASQGLKEHNVSTCIVESSQIAWNPAMITAVNLQ